MVTSQIAQHIDGEKLYQQRARRALPILVRQAEAGTEIYYSALAQELGMPNPRNLNYVLGAIGKTIEALSKKWKEKVPPIQCVVWNLQTRMPGAGIGWFSGGKEDFSSLPRHQQRRIAEVEMHAVHAYPRWRDVLAELELNPSHSVLPNLGPPLKLRGGEGSEHLALKHYVAEHPQDIGLPSQTGSGEVEFLLRSGDCMDVSFKTSKFWVGVEVKSRISCDQDIQRGLFQCVKYRAVMEAEMLAAGLTEEVRALLVLETALPELLIPLRNLLGVEVLEDVGPAAN